MITVTPILNHMNDFDVTENLTAAFGSYEAAQDVWAKSINSEEAIAKFQKLISGTILSEFMENKQVVIYDGDTVRWSELALTTNWQPDTGTYWFIDVSIVEMALQEDPNGLIYLFMSAEINYAQCEEGLLRPVQNGMAWRGTEYRLAEVEDHIQSVLADPTIPLEIREDPEQMELLAYYALPWEMDKLIRLHNQDKLSDISPELLEWMIIYHAEHFA